MEMAAGSDRRYDMCVAGRFTAQQRGIRRPPGISVRMGRCLASETGACTRGRRCSSVPALPLGRSRRRSGCDSPCSNVGSAMPGRACRSPMPGPPPDITPVPRREHQRLGERRAVRAREPQITVGRRVRIDRTAGTAIRWPRATPTPDPFSWSAQHGRSRPRGCAASGCGDRHHAGLLPRLTDGTLRSSPSTHRSACASDL